MDRCDVPIGIRYRPPSPPYLHWWGAHRSHEQLQNFIDPLIAGPVPLLVFKGSGFWAVENSKFAELLCVIVQNVQWICSEAQVESLYSPSNQHKNGAEHVGLKDYVPFGARPIFRYYVSLRPAAAGVAKLAARDSQLRVQMLLF